MRRINQSQADIKPFHYRSPERWHWSPGQPIPQTFDPAPHEALRRHAAAHEAWELEQAAKVLTFTPRSTSPAGGQRRAA